MPLLSVALTAGSSTRRLRRWSERRRHLAAGRSSLECVEPALSYLIAADGEEVEVVGAVDRQDFSAGQRLREQPGGGGHRGGRVGPEREQRGDVRPGEVGQVETRSPVLD